VFAAFVKINK